MSATAPIDGWAAVVRTRCRIQRILLIATIVTTATMITVTTPEAKAVITTPPGVIEVIGAVNESSPGVFDYSYTIDNSADSPSFAILVELLGLQVNGFALPLFDSADTSILGGEGGLSAPEGWTGQVTASAGHWAYDPALDPLSDTYGVDPNAFLAPPLVVLFSTDDPDRFVDPGTSLAGFGFSSGFGPGDAPVTIHATADGQSFALIEDPPYPATPNSPHAIPEPLSAGLAALGGCALIGYLRRRRWTRDKARRSFPGRTSAEPFEMMPPHDQPARVSRHPGRWSILP